jgi:pheromone shutdown-related protein TraB
MPIKIVPTSHIAEQSLRDIRNAIEKVAPDLIAVELDMDRFIAMQSEEKTSTLQALKSLGFFNFLVYSLMKRIQNWLGKKVGILPGSEMLTAVRLAEDKAINVAFIDRDVRLTFLRMGSVPITERLKLVWFMIKGFTVGALMSKLGRGRSLDLRKLPPEELIDQAMTLLRKEFPNIYRVLVRERDIYMARKLLELSERYSRIVAVVGAGHRKGLEKTLGKAPRKPQ